MCLNRITLTERKPKNWIEAGYKIRREFFMKWRAKFGGVKCDCKEVVEEYRPWYGFTWYHSDECAIVKYVKKYPQRTNFCWNYDPLVIGQSE